jgi:uncharacterized protein
MKIWAISDLHLSFGVQNKSMDIFGPAWKEHAKKIEESWTSLVAKDDLVLIPGDISWGLRLEEAILDLRWIDRLPGTKLLLKGNHDYWWGSLKKLSAILPPSLHVIQNNSFRWKNTAVGGARLWDTPEYGFNEYIDFQPPVKATMIDKEAETQEDLSEKIFERELQRLEMSLSSLPSDVKIRIAMTHYPPIGADLKPSKASEILEKHRIDVCVFGHLHNVKANLSLFGTKNSVRYVLASSDYLRFQPILISSTE